jgi:hypothetical protein
MNILKVSQLELKVIWNKFQKAIKDNPVNFLIYIFFAIIIIWQVAWLRQQVFEFEGNYSPLNYWTALTLSLSLGVYFYFVLDSSKVSRLYKLYIPISIAKQLKAESINNLLKTIPIALIFYLLFSTGTRIKFYNEYYINELIGVFYFVGLLIFGVLAYILIKQLVRNKVLSIVFFQFCLIYSQYELNDKLIGIFESLQTIYVFPLLFIFGLILFVLIESKGRDVVQNKFYTFKQFSNSSSFGALLALQCLRIENIILYLTLSIGFLTYELFLKITQNNAVDYNWVIAFFVISISFIMVVKYKLLAIFYTLSEIKLKLQKFEIFILSLGVIFSIIVLKLSSVLTLETLYSYISLVLIVFVIFNLIRLSKTDNFASLIHILLCLVLYQVLIPSVNLIYILNEFRELIFILVSICIYTLLFFANLHLKANDI